MKIVWTDIADDAVMRERAYLAERNPDAASAISIAIDRAVERLARHPELGASVVCL